MPRLAPVTTQTLSWSSRSIAAGKLPGMRPAAVRRRAVAALAGSLAAAALALAALGVAGGRGPLGARPAPDGAASPRPGPSA